MSKRESKSGIAKSNDRSVGKTTQEATVSVVPANEASWEDLEVILGSSRCHGAKCYCQRFKIPNSQWYQTDDNERAFLLRLQTDCGNSESGNTSGFIAYLENEPVGWCAVEPRKNYKNLLNSRVPWGRAGRKQERQRRMVYYLFHCTQGLSPAWNYSCLNANCRGLRPEERCSCH